MASEREYAPRHAVIESVDFGPTYDGETYAMATFRIPVACVVVPGLWEIRPIEGTRPEWSFSKDERAALSKAT